MSAPPKPWERVGTNFHSFSSPRSNDLGSNSFTGVPGPNGGPVPIFGHSLTSAMSGSSNPPPIPPRQHVGPLRPSVFGSSMYGNGYGGYSPYSSMYGGGYGGMGGVGRFGGYSMYGGNDSYSTSDGGFIQMAEESSRPAFQSIESIVHAVGSVSMMLESTYFAMHSSFRAVVGVAHHFGQMKNQFSQILSAFAIIRSLRWLCNKILYVLGITNLNPSIDNIWSAVSQEINVSGMGETDIKRQKSNWLFIMFVAIVFGTPWLIWKIFMSVAGMDNNAQQNWMSGKAEHYLAVAQYDFVGESEREVNLKAGQSIRLAPKELQPKVRGWLLASVDGQRSGLVPANYIKILRKDSNPTLVKQQGENGNEEPIVVEVPDSPTNATGTTSDVLTEEFLKER